jgi:hypothetical protein
MERMVEVVPVMAMMVCVWCFAYALWSIPHAEKFPTCGDRAREMAVPGE